VSGTHRSIAAFQHLDLTVCGQAGFSVERGTMLPSRAFGECLTGFEPDPLDTITPPIPDPVPFWINFEDGSPVGELSMRHPPGWGIITADPLLD